uniref:Aminotransferase class I/classII large domain-containing protein n=1 Tax=Pseudo-nitzschia multistriata TaxID=183589 RepID=A0A448YUI1_9STRA
MVGVSERRRSIPGLSICVGLIIVSCFSDIRAFVPSVHQGNQNHHLLHQRQAGPAASGGQQRFTVSNSRPLAATNGESGREDDNAFRTANRSDGQMNQTTGGLASGSPGQAIQRLGGNPGPTVWTEFGRIAQEHDPVNLGQGFPDWLPPKFAVDSLVEAVLDSAQSPHQYTRPAGHPNLVNQLARRYSIHMQKEIDPMDEVAVTVGASQALYLSLQTLVQPGDEVVLFEPFFDLYVNQVKLAGGTPVFVPLRFEAYNDDDDDDASGGEWKLDRDELMKVVSPRTKAIILNSPHNPTGKIFSKSEMEVIAESLDLAGPDCVVLSDEVYKYIVHAPPKESDSSTDSPLCPGHTHFASLPGMWDRTITISSAGKTFSATGWQVGWCIGPKRLLSPIHRLLPYVQFCASTVIQEALARSLDRAELPYEGHASYYDYLKHKYTRKRDLLAEALTSAGFAVPDYERTPGGGFFILARAGPEIQKVLPERYVLAENEAAPGGIARQDWALCQWMAEEIGLLCIPSSPFFSLDRVKEGVSDSFIRVAFCKTDETIEAAAQALKQLKVPEAVVAE